MNKDTSDFAYKLVKEASKRAVKKGAATVELSDEIASFLVSQLTFTMDLIKKGHKITPANLTFLFIDKGIGIAKIPYGKQYECGIAIAESLILLGKLYVSPVGGPLMVAWTAYELMAKAYDLNTACGISERVNNGLGNAHNWAEQGIIQWISTSNINLSGY